MLLSHRSDREIEIKLRVADIGALVRKLRRLGAISRGRVFERNILYDTPDSAFRGSGCLLRLRIESPAPAPFARGGSRGAILTFKASPSDLQAIPRGRFKERQEKEVSISQASKWPSMLRRLGLRPGFRYEKYRSSFRLGALHLDLDETPVGVFLELEGIPADIERVARALGYSPRHYLCATYWDLYAVDCRGRGRTPTNLLFRGPKSS